MLSDIATLAEDDAETFPTPVQLQLALPGRESWPMEKTTVRKYAVAMIERYCNHSAALSELHLGQIKSEDLRKTLAEFATKRDPSLCTPVFAVAMDRATGGSRLFRTIDASH